MYYHSVGEALDDNTRLFGGTRRRFFWKEKQGLVSGNRRSFVFVQNTTCLFGGTRKRLFREKNKGLVCGKRRRFVLIRTGRVSSVEPESVSSVRKRKVWSVEREKGLFLSEQDLSLRWNQKAFPLCTEKTWYGKEDSKSKAGMAAAFGSILDYNVGVAWAPTSKSTASDRSEIYLRNLSDLIANRGLRLSYRGAPSRLAGIGGGPPLPIKYYNAQTRIARKTPTAVRPLLTLRR